MITVFGDWGDISLVNFLDTHLQKLEAIKSVYWSLFWNLFKSGQNPAVGLLPVSSIEIPALELKE